jgi:hypothetical protein
LAIPIAQVSVAIRNFGGPFSPSMAISSFAKSEVPFSGVNDIIFAIKQPSFDESFQLNARLLDRSSTKNSFCKYI